MKTIQKTLRVCLALLLALCCLCGSAAGAVPGGDAGFDDPFFPDETGTDGTDVGPALDPDTEEPAEDETVIRQEVTLVYFTYPGRIDVGAEGVITARPATFLTNDGGEWFGTYGKFDYTITRIQAVSGNEKILSVSAAAATDAGWEIAMQGVSAGKTNVTLTVVGSISYNGESQPIRNTQSLSVEVTGEETQQVYVYTEADDNGMAFPERASVPDSGTVTLSFSAKQGYQIDSLLICDAHGKLLKRVDLSREEAQNKSIQLREVHETVYVKLLTAAAHQELRNPFRDLRLEDFENPYTDLNTTDWYYEPVAMMSMAGMFDGIDFEDYLPAGTQPMAFDPSAAGSARTYRVTTLAAKTETAKKAPTKRLYAKANGTRAVTVMELHNASDNLNLKSASYTKSPFLDVTADKSCFQAVLWAADKGIVYGYGNGYFGTYDGITREQMCAILLRTAQKIGLTLPETSPAKNFTDAGSVSSWAQSAVAACSKAGIINGFPDGSFKPKNKIVNGEIATMVYRFLNLLP